MTTAQLIRSQLNGSPAFGLRNARVKGWTVSESFVCEFCAGRLIAGGYRLPAGKRLLLIDSIESHANCCGCES